MNSRVLASHSGLGLSPVELTAQAVFATALGQGQTS